MRGWWVVLAAAAATLALLAAGHIGGHGGAAGGTSGGIVEVVDALGRRVQVPANVSRVVAVGPGALRIVVYLGAWDRVVGVEAVEKRWGPAGRPYVMAHPELLGLPVVSPGGPGRAPDPEGIMSVHPDVVLATFLTREEADRLQRETGVPVVVLGSPVLTSLGDLEGFYRALRLAGRVLGRETRAEELVSYVEGLVSDLRGRVEGAAFNGSVYVGGVGFRGKHGLTSTWCRFPVFEVLGVESVVDRAGCGRPGHVEVDREFLLRYDPDVVFIDENGLFLVLEDYRRDPGFYEGLRAFRLGRVYGLLPFNYYATNYELVLADAYYVGKVLFPDRFRDVDPAAKADEIIGFFVGKGLYRELAERYGGFGRLDLSRLAGG